MKILIIEDEKEIADGIQAILAQEGYESDAVYDGENVLSGQVIGNASYKESISQQSLSRMYHAAPSKYKLGSYIFSKKTLNNGNILIVAMNFSSEKNTAVKIICSLLLAVSGILLLIAVSFYLSKYVTGPAEEALEREKRFISDASHELKTPLGAININAQALELKGDASIYVRNILTETGRMNRLVERLLTLSRLEENELRVRKNFSLSDVAQEMLLTYESIAFETGKQLSYTIEENLMLNGCEDEIRQLIAILLDNAIKNSDEHGLIDFKCRQSSQNIEITVKNSGKGIDAADLEHIFERFYTTDRSRNNGSFGLGLAIAKAIVERHGGEIAVQSIPMKETLFTVRL